MAVTVSGLRVVTMARLGRYKTLVPNTFLANDEDMLNYSIYMINDVHWIFRPVKETSIIDIEGTKLNRWKCPLTTEMINKTFHSSLKL